jgi:hypothetical protein
MTEILALLQNIAPLLEKTIFHQMSQVIFGMLVAGGQRKVEVTEPSRGCFFRNTFLKTEDECVIECTKVVASKTGKET